MDWSFILVLFGVLVIAGILIHVLVRGGSLTISPPPVPVTAEDVAVETNAPTPLPVENDLEAIRIYKPDSWCFVHEDHLGRWCVKTASPASCDPTRRFPSREACELVSASALPLGIVENGGAGKRTFIAMMANGLS